MKIIIDNYVWYNSPTGWIKCGRVKNGIDGPYIIWYK